MRQFDSVKSAAFFNDQFARLERSRTSTPETKLRHRDHLFRRYLLAKSSSPKRILDFGCGQGNQLVDLIQLGHDAIGMEPNRGMSEVAAEGLAALGIKDRLITGGVDEFCALPDRSFDIITMMGVFQYLSDEQYNRILKAVPRILRPGGYLAATFQNSLFDMFTFNKYTSDFIVNEMFSGLLTDEDKSNVEKSINSLLINPTMPAYDEFRARDNIFVRLTNPLTIDKELRELGFVLETKYFYEWFGGPPLVAAKLPAFKRIAAHFELENPTDWQGHFMANAFLAHIHM